MDPSLAQVWRAVWQKRPGRGEHLHVQASPRWSSEQDGYHSIRGGWSIETPAGRIAFLGLNYETSHFKIPNYQNIVI